MDEYIKKSDIKKAFLKGFTDRKKYPEFVNWIAKEAERIVSDMPTADVQPVKHGRWIISNIYAQCSECSVAYDLDTFKRLIPMNENVPRHCSYCGARMDGEYE